ncbi:thiol peroxidase [Helcococcus kunzii]|uniref:Thioredoxin domain-containing protein n=1 Tax=Helcococcus kunzii ATCC 51366 TaxID=883114 RepID=H3NNV9_9FIRM|nr:thiol peroxidase [Helcococcus kunzii]EHR34084.1 hypothetical protein HMPREF9709_01020 [Helcococcus kunzii ATCC 51366]MCT1795693.1 thiol peroxidase [Helcococcus kunzii]MCT1988654.1 thiol peroxidase [Helcococcus kunzii]QUY64932.1 thiol peroxidase [Helcococcus kunzii]QZO75639.1 thiol peroxidase [Helcococcus kunzii]
MKYTFKDKEITLLGNQVYEGDIAPDFTATKNDMTEYNLSDDLGKIIVISVVPSIDTSVCSIQTKFFNEEATKLSDDVKIITVSMDLPFAQKRFCAAEGIENIEIVSDYKYREFGEKYGFLIDELKLLSRGIIIIDKDGKIVYTEYVEESTNEVDYDTAINKIKELI